jgi:hypothetical protein
MNSALTKYAAALIQIAIVLVAALAQLTGRVTLVDALQLIALGANALLVYLVPLFGAAMRSGWKTGVAVLGALIAAGIPFATVHHITGSQIAVVLLAGLQVLGAHIGVQIRNAATNGTTSGETPQQAAVEPPTVTTINRAVSTNGGEFIGESAR